MPFINLGFSARGAEKGERGARAPQNVRAIYSLLYVYSNQTRRAFPCHESARPAIAGIKKLLVTPKHLQPRTRRFLPPNFLIDVPFPGRRVTGHQVHIERCRPTENAVTRPEESLITWRRHSSETFAGILGGGCERAERENLASRRQCKLVVFG